MPRACVVGGCSKGTKDGVSLHTFPQNESVRKIWISRVKLTRAKWDGPSLHSLVCSAHFAEEDFEDPGLYAQLGFVPKKRVLRPKAIPVIKLGTAGSQSPDEKPRRSAVVKLEKRKLLDELLSNGKEEGTKRDPKPSSHLTDRANVPQCTSCWDDPKVPLEEPATSEEYVPAGTEKQREICGIWASTRTAVETRVKSADDKGSLQLHLMEAPPTDSDAGTLPETPPMDSDANPLPGAWPTDSDASSLPEASPVDSDAGPLSEAPPMDSDADLLPQAPPIDSDAGPLPEAPPMDSDSSPLPEAPPMDSDSSPLPESPPTDSDAGPLPDDPPIDPGGTAERKEYPCQPLEGDEIHVDDEISVIILTANKEKDPPQGPMPEGHPMDPDGPGRAKQGPREPPRGGEEDDEITVEIFEESSTCENKEPNWFNAISRKQRISELVQNIEKEIARGLQRQEEREHRLGQANNVSRRIPGYLNSIKSHTKDIRTTLMNECHWNLKSDNKTVTLKEELIIPCLGEIQSRFRAACPWCGFCFTDMSDVIDHLCLAKERSQRDGPEVVFSIVKLQPRARPAVEWWKQRKRKVCRPFHSGVWKPEREAGMAAGDKMLGSGWGFAPFASGAVKGWDMDLRPKRQEEERSILYKPCDDAAAGKRDVPKKEKKKKKNGKAKKQKKLKEKMKLKASRDEHRGDPRPPKEECEKNPVTVNKSMKKKKKKKKENSKKEKLKKMKKKEKLKKKKLKIGFSGDQKESRKQKVKVVTMKQFRMFDVQTGRAPDAAGFTPYNSGLEDFQSRAAGSELPVYPVSIMPSSLLVENIDRSWMMQDACTDPSNGLPDQLMPATQDRYPDGESTGMDMFGGTGDSRSVVTQRRPHDAVVSGGNEALLPYEDSGRCLDPSVNPSFDLPWSSQSQPQQMPFGSVPEHLSFEAETAGGQPPISPQPHTAALPPPGQRLNGLNTNAPVQATEYAARVACDTGEQMSDGIPPDSIPPDLDVKGQFPTPHLTCVMCRLVYPDIQQLSTHQCLGAPPDGEAASNSNSLRTIKREPVEDLNSGDGETIW